MNKISVVTICFNEEKNIRNTIESVLNQTYADIEYVIKDGGSTDKTNAIISECIENYDNINTKHISKKDTGIYDAMNQAVEECSGDWIIFINAGDRFATHGVLNDIFADKFFDNSDILYGHALTKDFSGSSVWKADIKKMPYKMAFSHQACFMRTDLIKELKFDMQYRIAADYELLLRCYEQGKTFENVDKVIAIFQLDGISSTDYLAKEREHYKVWKKHGMITWEKRMKYPISLGIAWIKGVVDKFFPIALQIRLRKIYKTNVKGYIGIVNENNIE